MTSRRQFFGLAGATAVAFPGILQRVAAAEAVVGGFGASTGGPAGSASGASASSQPSSQARILVDWHSHFVSETEVRVLSARGTPPRIIKAPDGSTRIENPTTVSTPAGKPGEYSPSDIEARIRHLDEHGISRQLLSHTVALGLDATLPLNEQRPLFRSFNDELARVIRQHPTRFLAVAAIPSADPTWAADELKRAHQELGFIGGSLPLNAFATLEGARTLAPLFKVAQGLRSHFFIHRGPANAAIPGQPPLIQPSDTDSLRWSLINNTHLTAGGITLGLTDFLDPYPDVSVEIVMLAGFLPYLTDSWIEAANTNGIPNPLQRLRRLYIDPGPYSRNGDWVRQAAEKLGADRILFGTDYGVGGGARGDVGPAIATLDKSLTELERQQIYWDNSKNLLRAKGVPL